MERSFEITNFKTTMKKIDFNFSHKLGEGASGTVYKEKIGNEVCAVKIYNNPSKIEFDKIEYMIRNIPNNTFQVYDNFKIPNFSWPFYFVIENFNNYQRYIGYITPYIDEQESFSLDYFYDFNLSKKLNIKDRTAITHKRDLIINLCELIEDLHKKDIYFVDLKPQNIRVFEKNLKVSLLDCDGYSIFNLQNKIRYNANMVSTDYISPELSKNNLSQSYMDINQDLYALSVIIFQLLNNGIHPYQGILKQKNFENLINDEKAKHYLYAYGLKNDIRIAPMPNSIHETFLQETRELFDKAFMPNTIRPSASEWKEHFIKISNDKLIVPCDKFPKEFKHLRFKNMNCPLCKINDKKITSGNTISSSERPIFKDKENKFKDEAIIPIFKDRNNSINQFNKKDSKLEDFIFDNFPKIIFWICLFIFLTTIYAFKN